MISRFTWPNFKEGNDEEGTKVHFVQVLNRKVKWIIARNSNPYIFATWFFNLLIVLDQIVKVWNVKGLRIEGCKDMGI